VTVLLSSPLDDHLPDFWKAVALERLHRIERVTYADDQISAAYVTRAA
jgi:hypothetical protein